MDEVKGPMVNPLDAPVDTPPTDAELLELGRRVATVKVAEAPDIPLHDKGVLATILGGAARQLVLVPGKVGGKSCTFVCVAHGTLSDGDSVTAKLALAPALIVVNHELAPMIRGPQGEGLMDSRTGKLVDDGMPGQYL